MSVRKIILPVVGLGAVIGCLLLKMNLSSNDVAKVASKVTTEPEKTFEGIPLSKLTELAKEMYHGLSCTIDKWGFLVFHHKSNRGRQTFHPQMTLDDVGKLINLGGHYPGQLSSTADEFAKRANEMFEFKK
jgi:hypothetical protein